MTGLERRSGRSGSADSVSVVALTVAIGGVHVRATVDCCSARFGEVMELTSAKPVVLGAASCDEAKSANGRDNDHRLISVHPSDCPQRPSPQQVQHEERSQ